MSRKLPPLNALRAFESAARHKSFTNAADELFVTHSAVSQQIRILEDFFQLPLFSRAKGKVQLNAAGQKLLPVISEALDQIDTVSSHLLASSALETLTVSLTAAFAAQWLIPRLSDFEQAYPNIIVRLSPSGGFPDLAAGQADIALRWGVTHHSGVEAEKLFDVDTFAACAPALLQGENPLRCPSDLVRHTLIHDDDGYAWQALLEKAGVNNLDHRKGLFYADSLLALQEAVKGNGVIAAGSILAAQDLAAGHLVIPFEPIIQHRNSYYLFCSKNAVKQERIRVFREWLFGQVSLYQQETINYGAYLVGPA